MLPCFASIFHPNVIIAIFSPSCFIPSGRAMYQMALTLCRFVAWNYFADLRMEVLKVTQHPENWSIQARWRITGLPFHVLLLRFYKRDKSELYR